MKKNDNGFSLIELLVVMVILGILTSLAAPRLAGKTEGARIKATHADIEGGIALALDMYDVDIGKYPNKLEDLVKDPAVNEFWDGPYLKKGIPKDPWGNDYIYKFPGSTHSDGYDLYSLGSDGQDGTGDEIVNE